MNKLSLPKNTTSKHIFLKFIPTKHIHNPKMSSLHHDKPY